MKKVFHTTLTKHRDDILTNGLKRGEKSLLDKDEIDHYQDSYILPENRDDPLGYAQNLVWTILEQERPSHFPKHHNCLFFFPTQNLIGELDRPIALQIDTEAFTDHYPLTQAPFDIATELFFDTMQQFEILNQINADKLHTLATQYWDGAELVHTRDDIKSRTELLVETSHINPEYITEF